LIRPTDPEKFTKAAKIQPIGSVGHINLILFALDSVNQAASFDYNKPVIKETLNDLKGGGLILAAKVGKVKSHFLKNGKKSLF
jgi:hypothetical protein